MKIPKFMLPHTFKHYAFKGSGAYGPVWEDTPQKGHARFERKRQRTTDSDGSEIVTNVSGTIHPDTNVQTGDKVEWKGQTYEVAEAVPQDAHAGTHHIEAVLK